jgi:hypothetical protein
MPKFNYKHRDDLVLNFAKDPIVADAVAPVASPLAGKCSTKVAGVGALRNALFEKSYNPICLFGRDLIEPLVSVLGELNCPHLGAIPARFQLGFHVVHANARAIIFGIGAL